METEKSHREFIGYRTNVTSLKLLVAGKELVEVEAMSPYQPKLTPSYQRSKQVKSFQMFSIETIEERNVLACTLLYFVCLDRKSTYYKSRTH